MGLEEMEETLQSVLAEIKALGDREQVIQGEMKDRTAARDKQKSQELKTLEDEHSKLSKEIASTESKIKNRKSDLDSSKEGRQKSQSALDDLKKQVEQKDKAYQKEKSKWDALAEQDTATKRDIEKAQWTMQALTAGMSEEAAQQNAEGEGKSLREQMLAAQT